jgi:hypothetical protein
VKNRRINPQFILHTFSAMKNNNFLLIMHILFLIILPIASSIISQLLAVTTLPKLQRCQKLYFSLLISTTLFAQKTTITADSSKGIASQQILIQSDQNQLNLTSNASIFKDIRSKS